MLEDEVLVIVPACAYGDDGVLRGAFADGYGQAGLNAVPAVGIADLGFIERFKEDEVGIVGGKVLG